MRGARVRLLGLVFVAGLLSGCAAGSATQVLDAEAKQFQARADTACIYVVPSNSDTAVRVLLDGRTVASLDALSYLRLDVPPGRHVLAVARETLLPGFLRETPQTLPVEVEAGRCYFYRALWREDEQSLRSYRVYLDRVTPAEGEREINIRTLVLPSK